MSEKDTLACLRLHGVRGVGSYTANRLLEHFGSASSFWQAGEAAWQAQPGIGPKLIAALQQSSVQDAQQVLQYCQQHGISVLVRDDAGYPPALKALEDAPLVMFYRGNPEILQAERMLAVVGARKASQQGRKLTRQWCQQFSEAGVVVVSGMAYGIDAAAHGGALAGTMPTVAVLGCGLATLYPLQQRQQAAIIDDGGCVLSEYLPQQDARPEHFPQRNRIIAGLTQATLVMEADVASGSLISAKHAVRYGREVLAVPGNVTVSRHAGCHQLIRDGATLVESATDVLTHMAWEGKASASADCAAELATCTPRQQKIVALLQGDVLHVDQLAEACGCSVAELAADLLTLEFKAFIESLPGGRYASV